MAVTHTPGSNVFRLTAPTANVVAAMDSLLLLSDADPDEPALRLEAALSTLRVDPARDNLTSLVQIDRVLGQGRFD